MNGPEEMVSNRNGVNMAMGPRVCGGLAVEIDDAEPTRPIAAWYQASAARIYVLFNRNLLHTSFMAGGWSLRLPDETQFPVSYYNAGILSGTADGNTCTLVRGMFGIDPVDGPGFVDYDGGNPNLKDENDRPVPAFHITLGGGAPQGLTTPSVGPCSSGGLTDTTVTIDAAVAGDGGATVFERGVCWGTSVNPTIAGSHTVSGSGTGVFSVPLTGLAPDTVYHVRSYAVNALGTTYSADIWFRTNMQAIGDPDEIMGGG